MDELIARWSSGATCNLRPAGCSQRCALNTLIHVALNEQNVTLAELPIMSQWTRADPADPLSSAANRMGGAHGFHPQLGSTKHCFPAGHRERMRRTRFVAL